jgi:endoglucanase
MLGETGQSYVVGFGSRYPSRPQSMGASCPGTPTDPIVCDPGNSLFASHANPHTLYGALVEQSNFTDVYSDIRTANASRIAIDYNAGFSGVLAGLNEAPGTWDECLQGWGILSKDTAVCEAAV